MFQSLKRIFPVIVAFGSFGMLGPDADAQAPRTLNTVERRIETLNRQAKDFERDNMGRDDKTKNAETAKLTRQLRVEIEEDLKALQSLYNDAVMALQSGPDLRPGFGAETGRAARKHAVRLKSNLALPALDEKEARTAPPPLPDTDRKTLTALCKAVHALITNPMFDGTAGIGVENGTKARMELDAIIRLAEHLSEVPESASR